MHGKEQCLIATGVGAEVALGGQGLMFSLSAKKELKLYSAGGREMATLEPNSLANHDLVVSQDARCALSCLPPAADAHPPAIPKWNMACSQPRPHGCRLHTHIGLLPCMVLL